MPFLRQLSLRHKPTNPTTDETSDNEVDLDDNEFNPFDQFDMGITPDGKPTSHFSSMSPYTAVESPRQTLGELLRGPSAAAKNKRPENNRAATDPDIPKVHQNAPRVTTGSDPTLRRVAGVESLHGQYRSYGHEKLRRHYQDKYKRKERDAVVKEDESVIAEEDEDVYEPPSRPWKVYNKGKGKEVPAEKGKCKATEGDDEVHESSSSSRNKGKGKAIDEDKGADEPPHRSWEVNGTRPREDCLLHRIPQTSEVLEDSEVLPQNNISNNLGRSLSVGTPTSESWKRNGMVIAEPVLQDGPSRRPKIETNLEPFPEFNNAFFTDIHQEDYHPVSGVQSGMSTQIPSSERFTGDNKLQDYYESKFPALPVRSPHVSHKSEASTGNTTRSNNHARRGTISDPVKAQTAGNVPTIPGSGIQKQTLKHMNESGIISYLFWSSLNRGGNVESSRTQNEAEANGKVVKDDNQSHCKKSDNGQDDDELFYNESDDERSDDPQPGDNSADTNDSDGEADEDRGDEYKAIEIGAEDTRLRIVDGHLRQITEAVEAKYEETERKVVIENDPRTRAHSHAGVIANANEVDALPSNNTADATTTGHKKMGKAKRVTKSLLCRVRSRRVSTK